MKKTPSLVELVYTLTQVEEEDPDDVSPKTAPTMGPHPGP